MFLGRTRLYCSPAAPIPMQEQRTEQRNRAPAALLDAAIRHELQPPQEHLDGLGRLEHTRVQGVIGEREETEWHRSTYRNLPLQMLDARPPNADIFNCLKFSSSSRRT